MTFAQVFLGQPLGVWPSMSRIDTLAVHAFPRFTWPNHLRHLQVMASPRSGMLSLWIRLVVDVLSSLFRPNIQTSMTPNFKCKLHR